MAARGVAAKLNFIKAHFSKLPETIKKLESSGKSLVENFQTVENFCEELFSTPGPLAESVSEKMKSMLKRNPGYALIKQVSHILDGSSEDTPEEIKPELISKFKFAPVTSCDVERSFSSHKNILTDKRQRLTPQNIEKMLIIYSNKQ